MQIRSVLKLTLFGILFAVAALTGYSNMAHAAEPVVIMNAEQLDDIRNDLTGNYILGSDIHLSGSVSWVPIDQFKGTLDGNGFIIHGLYIRVASGNFTGLFGRLQGTVRNLGLENVDIEGSNYTGAIAGQLNQDGKIFTSYASGRIKGNIAVGGLVGLHTRGWIENAYAQVHVSGGNYVGGMLGTIDGGTVINSYASGLVGGTGTEIGGLIGRVTSAGGTVELSYWDEHTTQQSVSAVGGTKLTTAEMMMRSSFYANDEGWDFDHVWEISENESYPFLRLFDAVSHIPTSEQFEVTFTYLAGGDGSGSGPKSGRLLQVVAAVYNKGDTGEDLILMLGVYDANGAMTDLAFTSTHVDADTNAAPRVGVTLPEEALGYTVKSFLWSGREVGIGFTNLVPLSTAEVWQH